MFWSCLAACFALASASPPAAPLDSAGYLNVADRLQRRLEPLWNGAYYDAGRETTTQVNADLLLVHAEAARTGHRGATRQDARARQIAQFLTSGKVWHGSDWWAGPADPRIHVVFEAEAAEGLAAAYAARDELGLDARTTSRIRQEIATLARSPDWRWPALALNQLNWYATVFAADATVNGRTRTLATDLARHIARFTASRGNPGNFGPGLRFNYQPARWPYAKMNFDSPEYANIVLGFARAYPQARAAGMAKPAKLALLRDWVRRVISGYWTHAGYLNWDTGLGYSRWLAWKKVGLAQSALIGVAASPELQPDPQYGEWAKWMLDRGLVEYTALAKDHIPPVTAYGVHEVPQARGNAYVAAARYESNAMRALQAGLGRQLGTEPPALYSYDPDTGRLAVTTPSYNTAIVAANHGAFPYGGVDLARLFNVDQDVAGDLGGVGAGAFGLIVTAHGRAVLHTQYGRRASNSPLQLVEPRRLTARDTQRQAHAGPFTELYVRGTVHQNGFTATSAYRFTPTAIEGHWGVSGPGGEATVNFP